MYFDEEMILDVRLNTLDKYVDYFIISESNFTHSGKRRDLNFDINKYKKFEDKIIYLIYDKEPSDVEAINENDHKNEKARKKIMNAVKRENGQRNYLQNGLKDAGNEDIILVSDVDEIPNLTNVNFTNFKNKIIQFKQDMFYYKFNLVLPKLDWTGTKGCRRKNLINLQWLRNIKDRKYSILRPDILLSKKKYSDIFFVENGGWHFTNIKSSKDIKYKLSSYLHHIEYDENPIDVNEIENIINKKMAIYDLNLDKKLNKLGEGKKLELYDMNKLPPYIKENKKKFEGWLD
tara:strand:- start:1537 stop:2406 length:870 start_codon:yes stop_codon:yes gene_type:complete